ncbi:hypothetical protein AR457_01180 [Streptomyces agglomeratus]|nr:hypothetical protein AR457_01180 [Streptomyces agglomeratus]OEJ55144.1 hypothetical protein BGK72_34520 [Streptomyces agglomeratus]
MSGTRAFCGAAGFVGDGLGALAGGGAVTVAVAVTVTAGTGLAAAGLASEGDTAAAIIPTTRKAASMPPQPRIVLCLALS